MAKVISVDYEVFSFDQLSDDAKQNALNHYIDSGLNYEWWDCIYYDIKTVAGLMGWDIEEIYFTGFHSQGDGACIVGTMGYSAGCYKKVKEHAPNDTRLQSIAADWQELQRRYFYSLGAKIEHTGRYHHSRSVSIDAWDNRRDHYNYDFIADGVTDEITAIARDFMDYIHEVLEREYNYLTSLEALAEANEWEYLADGSIFSY